MKKKIIVLYNRTVKQRSLLSKLFLRQLIRASELTGSQKIFSSLSGVFLYKLRTDLLKSIAMCLDLAKLQEVCYMLI